MSNWGQIDWGGGTPRVGAGAWNTRRLYHPIQGRKLSDFSVVLFNFGTFEIIFKI